MTSEVHSTTLRLPSQLWDAIRFINYLTEKSCNQIIIDILNESVPSHLDSLEYNMLDWQPNNPDFEKRLRPEFKKHEKNLHNLRGDQK